MTMKQQVTTQSSAHEEDLRRVAEFRLMDDDFFSEALDGKKEAVEYILNTILQREDLKVVSTSAQVEYKSATKRSIKLDIKAENTEGEILDVEIQRSDRGTGVRRARFHSSMIDRTLLAKGKDFEDLVDTYVIFITENDKFKEGIPLYHVERTIEEKEHAPFGDGTHIIYVNGEFRNLEHPIGRLMHDFQCKDAKDILNPFLADEVRYLKETEGGRGQMCRMLEEMREEAAKEAAAKATMEAAVETARKMLADKLPLEKVAEYTGLAIEEIRELM